jgi:hypothetical protein
MTRVQKGVEFINNQAADVGHEYFLTLSSVLEPFIGRDQDIDSIIKFICFNSV